MLIVRCFALYSFEGTLKSKCQQDNLSILLELSKTEIYLQIYYYLRSIQLVLEIISGTAEVKRLEDWKGLWPTDWTEKQARELTRLSMDFFTFRVRLNLILPLQRGVWNEIWDLSAVFCSSARASPSALTVNRLSSLLFETSVSNEIILQQARKMSKQECYNGIGRERVKEKGRGKHRTNEDKSSGRKMHAKIMEGLKFNGIDGNK